MGGSSIMNTTSQTREPSAAEQVKEIAERQIEAIRLLLCPTEEDVELTRGKDGEFSLDIDCDIEHEISADDVADHTDEDGELDLEDLVSEHWDKIREQAYERFCEHGLSFDYYVRQDEDGEDCEEESHWTYLISTGGPGTEIRFFAGQDLALTRAEFWFLPWFDGASTNVTKDPTVQALWEQFTETETARVAREKADAEFDNY